MTLRFMPPFIGLSSLSVWLMKNVNRSTASTFPATSSLLSSASLDNSVRSADPKISSYNEATTYPASSVAAALFPVLPPIFACAIKPADDLKICHLKIIADSVDTLFSCVLSAESIIRLGLCPFPSEDFSLSLDCKCANCNYS